jgi:predicted peptidase
MNLKTAMLAWLSWTAAQSGLPGPKAGFIDKAVTLNGATFQYVVYVPKEYSADQPHPTLLSLHGSSEQGEDGRAPSNVGVGAAIRKAPEKWNFLVIFPQKRPGPGMWDEYEKQILAMIVQTKKEYKVDEKRLYATGFSMGGFVTCRLVSRHPEMFAAAVPICGGPAPEAAKMKDVPVWAFHGDQDGIPIKLSQEMIDTITAAGGHPKFTIYKGAGHEIWDRVYQEEKVNEWFLEHVKK